MLKDDLKTLLATEYAFVIKAQFFHWNVEGPDFAQLHEFFGELYEEVYGNSIDRTAEFIRVLDDYAPGSLERFTELSQIAGQLRVPRARLMIEELLGDNQRLMDLLIGFLCYALIHGLFGLDHEVTVLAVFLLNVS